MFPLAFFAGSLQGHWWGFISRNYVVWPIFCLMNVFIALKGTHFLFLFESTAYLKFRKLQHVFLWRSLQIHYSVTDEAFLAETSKYGPSTFLRMCSLLLKERIFVFFISFHQLWVGVRIYPNFTHAEPGSRFYLFWVWVVPFLCRSGPDFINFEPGSSTSRSGSSSGFYQQADHVE